MTKLTVTITSSFDEDTFTQDLQKVLELLKLSYQSAKLEGPDRSINYSIDRDYEDSPITAR